MTTLYFCEHPCYRFKLNNMNMKSLNLKHICFFLLAFLMLASSPAMAQKGKKEKKEKKEKAEKPPKEKKEKSVKPAKMTSNGSNAAVMASLSGMSREEKNTLSRCPLHNKHMSLSDNYRADASDFTTAESYPFAYQLNYRRYCKVCTRIMSKEAKGELAEVQEKNNKSGATFQRCEIHNQPLKTNPNYDPLDMESSPNKAEMPHARQYNFRTYCKVCTKVYKIQAGS